MDTARIYLRDEIVTGEIAIPHSCFKQLLATSFDIKDPRIYGFDGFDGHPIIMISYFVQFFMYCHTRNKKYTGSLRTGSRFGHMRTIELYTFGHVTAI